MASAVRACMEQSSTAGSEVTGGPGHGMTHSCDSYAGGDSDLLRLYADRWGLAAYQGNDEGTGECMHVEMRCGSLSCELLHCVSDGGSGTTSSVHLQSMKKSVHVCTILPCHGHGHACQSLV